MSFYSKMQKTATKLLKKFGKPQHLKLVTYVGGTPDPDFGGTAGATPNPKPLIGVVTKIDDSFIGSNIEGKTIISSDRLVIVDSGVEIPHNSQIQIGSQTLTVLGIVPINPAGTLIAQKVVCRGI